MLCPVYTSRGGHLLPAVSLTTPIVNLFNIANKEAASTRDRVGRGGLDSSRKTVQEDFHKDFSRRAPTVRETEREQGRERVREGGRG